MRKLLLGTTAFLSLAGAMVLANGQALSAPVDDLGQENAQLRKENSELRELLRLRDENAALRRRLSEKSIEAPVPLPVAQTSRVGAASPAASSAGRRAQMAPRPVSPSVFESYAADMPVKVPVQPVPYNWTGFYVGMSGGYGWSNNSVDVSSTVVPIADTVSGPVLPNVGIPFGTLSAASAVAAVPTSFKTDPHGAIVGGQFGYNWQFTNRWVGGVEADFLGGSVRGTSTLQGAGAAVQPGSTVGGTTFIASTATTASFATAEQKLDWLGTVRARLGFTVSERLLIYGTGGLAFGHVNTSMSLSETTCVTSAANPGAVACATGQAAGSSSQMRYGAAFGAGLEYAISQNWSLRTDYLHWDLGRVSYNPTALNIAGTFFAPGFGFVPFGASVGSQHSTRFNGDMVRVAINYKID